MFYVISKILGAFASPFIWILGVLGIFIWKKNKKWLYATLLLSFIFTNQVFYSIMVSFWAIPLVPIKKIPKADIAIVLGGASRIDLADTDRVFLNEGDGDRIIHAIQLYKMGKVKKILFTSGAGSLTGAGLSEALFAKKLFLMLGVLSQDLILETESKTTYENALFSALILKKYYPNQKYLLVTNALHERRGLACFKKQGIICLPFSINNEGSFDVYEWSYYYLPRAYVLNAWDRYLHELIGFCAYRLKGYC
jgi:uncharacterized SAM-binding protein YcdF (DUF218 family)